MRVALKLVLSTLLGIIAIFAVFGILRTERELELFDSDMRKDHGIIGTTLALCVANTWAKAGSENAVSLVAQADATRPALRIGFRYADGTAVARAPLLSTSPASTTPRIQHTVLRAPDQLNQSYLVSTFPVFHEGTLLGTIEVSESLETRNAHLHSTVRNTLVATGLMLLVAGLAVFVLGVWIVGRPLQRVANKAQRIGKGDFSGTLSLTQRDEIGQVAAEIDAMCTRIVEANRSRERETEARVRTVEQLRHAERLITVGRLAAGLAHELGTPLNIVGGRIKLLRRKLSEHTDIDRSLADMAQQVDFMTSIIRQLLDFARRRELRAQPTDLGQVAQRVQCLVEAIARQRNVTVVVRSTEPVVAMADPIQTEQVLSNVVINAIHASNSGGLVEIILENAPDEGSLVVAGKNREVAMSVKDQGAGMDNDTVTRVFEPFFTTKDVGEGVGLGLSVAHGIIEDHGGRIVVESEKGQGSTFRVFLPAAI